MILYLDTSALVKRYVLETGSAFVNDWIERAETTGSIALTRVEMASALAKAARMNWISARDAENAFADFIAQWPSFTRLSVTSVVVERASRLAWENGLRGYDAMHLAAALHWQETLELPVCLATFDRELWSVGRRMGVLVYPEELPR